MNIETKYLGDMNIAEDKLIQFSSGIPGFSEETSFVLLDLPENPVFKILQSAKSPEVAFIITNPYVLYSDYTFELDDNVMESLNMISTGDVTVFVIVTLKNPFHTSTLNLKAPIIINPNRRLGKQYILNKENYLSKAPIIPAGSEKERDF